MSSRTVSSSAARPVASHARCPSRAHTSQARIGTPRVTSWKSQFTIAWKGQESSRAATAARATPCPARRRANRYTGTADAARASAMTTPSMRGSGHTQ